MAGKHVYTVEITVSNPAMFDKVSDAAETIGAKVKIIEHEHPWLDDPAMPEGMIDHDEDRRAYREELNKRHRPSDY